jgi:hypothetical protein
VAAKKDKTNGAAVLDQPRNGGQPGQPQSRQETGRVGRTREELLAVGRATQFKPGGKTPNPGGRPRRNLLSQALLDLLPKPLPEKLRIALGGYAEVLPERATIADGMALANVISSISKLNVNALALAFDRTEGRLPQALSGQLDVTMSMRDKSSEELHEIVTDYIRSLEEAQREEAAAAKS